IYTGEMTVLKAISTAGGFTEFAKRNRVEVTRASGGKPVVVDCVKALKNPRLDIPIYPGDRIFVHKRVWL
ncbi:MAG: SLBB domain-containing protein, partial [Verrucomicrobiae bacterium]|nr:SLBB domain-containing protein [Verrucomicrobiae bacterium]